MKKIISVLKKAVQCCVFAAGLVFVCLATCGESMAAGNITNMRIGQQVGSVRIVFEADKAFDYKAFLLTDPKRLVVDVYDMEIKNTLQSDKNNIISQTRVGKLDAKNKRVVFDLLKPVFIKKAFTLKPQSNMKWRFVIDVALCSERDFKAKVGSKHAFSSQSDQNVKTA